MELSRPGQATQPRKIAENEADRQVIGDVRSQRLGDRGCSVVAGVIVFGIVWAWLNR